MGDVLTVLPRTSEEFYDNIEQLYKNRNHVKSIVVDEATATIKVSLDGTAHTFGHPDMKIPLKRGSLHQAQNIVGHINNDVASRQEPNRTDTDALFSLLDIH